MAPNERARQDHDALFPNHGFTLATTDPELIDLFDNFAFDEVLLGSGHADQLSGWLALQRGEAS